MPAAYPRTAGKKKPTVNAAATARVGYSEASHAIMNNFNNRSNRAGIALGATVGQQGGLQ